MRGILKSPPPSDISPVGQVPATLSDVEKVYLMALPGEPDKVALARSEYHKLEKSKLRRQMYQEQRSLCVYCERRIAERHPPPRIDHWQPLSLEPTLALSWNNLYLSCTKQDTCDSAKGNRRFRWDPADPDMPWPVNIQYEDIVGFTSRGEMYVRSDVALPRATRRALELAIADRSDGVRVRRAVVNLNHHALVTARAVAIASEREREERSRRNKTVARTWRRARATQLLGQDPRPAFVSVRVAWLRDELGRGQ